MNLLASIFTTQAYLQPHFTLSVGIACISRGDALQVIKVVQPTGSGIQSSLPIK